jgi:hypothetical protein
LEGVAPSIIVTATARTKVRRKAFKFMGGADD